MVATHHAKSSTRETPFNLVYGAEAVLPTELKYGSPRTRSYNESTKHEARIGDNCFLEEARCQAAVWHDQQGLRRYHSRQIRPQELEEGYWVLRRKQKTKGMNKFSSPWESPYWVVRVLKPGMARLETEEGCR